MISIQKLICLTFLFGSVFISETVSQSAPSWGSSNPSWPTPSWPTPPQWSWNAQWGWTPSPPQYYTSVPQPQWNQWALQPSQTNVDQVQTNQYSAGGSSQLDVIQQNTYPPGWSNSVWSPPANSWEFHSSDSWEQSGQDQWVHHLADTWVYNQETHAWEIQRHSQLWSRIQSGNSFVWVQANSDYAAGASSSDTTSHQQTSTSLVDTHSANNQWYQNSQSNWQTVSHQG